MRLLLDEMHAATVAVTLREQGFDVVAVTEQSDLRGLADADILTWAAAADRVVVTENVRDFAPLAQQLATAGRHHAGVLFTNPRRFDRASLAYPGTLITALAGWLTAAPGTFESQVAWL